MPKISLIFTQEVYETLISNAKQKKNTISQYLRSLIDIGLRVEEMSASKDPSDKEDFFKKEFNILKELLKKDLKSSYETLYLARYITSSIPDENKVKHEQMREESKNHAEAFVEGLLEVIDNK